MLIILTRFKPLLVKKYTPLIWLVLAVLLFLMVGFNIPMLANLTTRGETGDAVIKAIMPERHCTAQYSYQVNGKQYSGTYSFGSCHMPVGSHQPVYYDALHPEQSILAAPRAALMNDLIPAILAALLFPTLLLYGISRFQRTVAA